MKRRAGGGSVAKKLKQEQAQQPEVKTEVINEVILNVSYFLTGSTPAQLVQTKSLVLLTSTTCDTLGKTVFALLTDVFSRLLKPIQQKLVGLAPGPKGTQQVSLDSGDTIGQLVQKFQGFQLGVLDPHSKALEIEFVNSSYDEIIVATLLAPWSWTLAEIVGAYLQRLQRPLNSDQHNPGVEVSYELESDPKAPLTVAQINRLKIVDNRPRTNMMPVLCKFGTLVEALQVAPTVSLEQLFANHTLAGHAPALRAYWKPSDSLPIPVELGPGRLCGSFAWKVGCMLIFAGQFIKVSVRPEAVSNPCSDAESVLTLYCSPETTLAQLLEQAMYPVSLEAVKSDPKPTADLKLSMLPVNAPIVLQGRYAWVPYERVQFNSDQSALERQVNVNSGRWVLESELDKLLPLDEHCLILTNPLRWSEFLPLPDELIAWESLQSEFEPNGSESSQPPAQPQTQ